MREYQLAREVELDSNAGLGKIFKKIREYRGIEQSRVAKHLGISQASYSRFECGEVKESFERIQKLCMYFHSSVDVEFRGAFVYVKAKCMVLGAEI